MRTAKPGLATAPSHCLLLTSLWPVLVPHHTFPLLISCISSSRVSAPTPAAQSGTLGCSPRTKGRAIKPTQPISLWAAMSVCTTTAKPGAEALFTACSTLLGWEGLKAVHRVG